MVARMPTPHDDALADFTRRTTPPDDGLKAARVARRNAGTSLMATFIADAGGEAFDRGPTSGSGEMNTRPRTNAGVMVLTGNP